MYIKKNFNAIRFLKPQPEVERTTLAMILSKGILHAPAQQLREVTRSDLSTACKTEYPSGPQIGQHCAELDLVAMSWDEDRCPTDKHATTIQKGV